MFKRLPEIPNNREAAELARLFQEEVTLARASVHGKLQTRQHGAPLEVWSTTYRSNGTIADQNTSTVFGALYEQVPMIGNEETHLVFFDRANVEEGTQPGDIRLIVNKTDSSSPNNSIDMWDYFLTRQGIVYWNHERSSDADESNAIIEGKGPLVFMDEEEGVAIIESRAKQPIPGLLHMSSRQMRQMVHSPEVLAEQMVALREMREAVDGLSICSRIDPY